MNLWIIIGAIGSIASVVGLFLPTASKNQRLLHVVYGLAIAALASISVWHWQQHQRSMSVEKAASTLVGHARAYTSEGFIQAALAFLEKNKDLYPDSYVRATTLVEECRCTGSEDESSGTKAIDVSYALRGLLRGIGQLEADD